MFCECKKLDWFFPSFLCFGCGFRCLLLLLLSLCLPLESSWQIVAEQTSASLKVWKIHQRLFLFKFYIKAHLRIWNIKMSGNQRIIFIIVHYLMQKYKKVCETTISCWIYFWKFASRNFLKLKKVKKKLKNCQLENIPSSSFLIPYLLPCVNVPLQNNFKVLTKEPWMLSTFDSSKISPRNLAKKGSSFFVKFWRKF